MHSKGRAIANAGLFTLLSLGVRASSDTGPITNEKLRQDALRAVFSQMKISREPDKKLDRSFPKKAIKPDRPYYPDTLSSEAVYQVIGPAANEAESCASENLLTGGFSNNREVRLRVSMARESRYRLTRLTAVQIR